MLSNLLSLSETWDRGVAVIKNNDGSETTMLIVELIDYNPANHIYNHEVTGHVIDKWITERTGELSNSSNNLRNYVTYFENLPVHSISVYNPNNLTVIKFNKSYNS